MERKEYYKKSSIGLVKAKALNRTVYLALEEKRSEIDAQKGVVDRLQLSYENLLYKQAYLQREIRACKDLATPNLSEIEKELGRALGTTVFSNRLAEINAAAIESLKQEQASRVETEESLSKLKEVRNEALKKLDKKRKFLDDLPVKIESISAAANEIQKQFSEIQPLRQQS